MISYDPEYDNREDVIDIIASSSLRLDLVLLPERSSGKPYSRDEVQSLAAAAREAARALVQQQKQQRQQQNLGPRVPAAVIDLVSSDDEAPVKSPAAIFSSGAVMLGAGVDSDEVQIVEPMSRKRSLPSASPVAATSTGASASARSELPRAKRARIPRADNPLKFEPFVFGEADNEEITEVAGPHAGSTPQGPPSLQQVDANLASPSAAIATGDDDLVVIESGRPSLGAMDMPHPRGKTAARSVTDASLT